MIKEMDGPPVGQFTVTAKPYGERTFVYKTFVYKTYACYDLDEAEEIINKLYSAAQSEKVEGVSVSEMRDSSPIVVWRMKPEATDSLNAMIYFRVVIVPPVLSDILLNQGWDKS